MRIFLAGDTHGNARFLTEYLYPVAAALSSSAIVQLGDFGYWEHDPAGVEFLDQVAIAAEHHDLPLYFLHGNHDNWPLLMQRYGTQRTADGFVKVRPRVSYIPQGYAWNWAGFQLRSFGGAYSIDKQLRLEVEGQREERWWQIEKLRRAAGRPPRKPPTFAGTLWFPGEEMHEAEFAALMKADAAPKDIVFSHDKPRGSDCGLSLKDEPACWPNQDRLQSALHIHQPVYWFHGHLHHPYIDQIPCDETRRTTVVGLSCDDQAAGRFWKPYHAWGVLDLVKDAAYPIDYTPGSLAEDWVPQQALHG